MNEKWHGILKVLEIQHLDKDGKVLWQQNNIKNLLHTDGEDFILRVLFAGESLPSNYYLGLDNRSEVLAADTMTTIQNEGSEPSTNGYSRVVLTTGASFTIQLTVGGNTEALSPISSFSASGGSWGPIINLFLTTEADFSGRLISSVSLSNAVTVLDTETLTVRMALTLKDCPS